MKFILFLVYKSVSMYYCCFGGKFLVQIFEETCRLRHVLAIVNRTEQSSRKSRRQRD